MDEVIEKDESYALVGISRVNHSLPTEVFGSNIWVDHTIVLTIKRCEKRRGHNRDWYYGREQLAQVEMTAVQFAEFITSANIGDGVPCSLRYIDGKSIPYKTGRNIGDVFKSEVKGTFQAIKDKLKAAADLAKNTLGKPGQISAKQKGEIKDVIERLVMAVTDHLPFIELSFKETMERVVVEAKTEVQAYLGDLAHKHGLTLSAGQQTPGIIVELPANADDNKK